MPKLNFLTTAPTFPTQIVKLHELYQSFPTENDTRLIATTPQPQAPSALHQKLARTLAPHAARIITSALRFHHPNVWSNSSSGISSGATPYRAIFEHA